MFLKIKLIMSKLWVFLKPFVVVFLTAVGQALADAATDAVAKAAGMPEDTTGVRRRATAYASIEEAMKAAGYQLGVDFTESMVNTAIEVAVQGLKNK